jgi:hypothetical protein
MAYQTWALPDSKLSSTSSGSSPSRENNDQTLPGGSGQAETVDKHQPAMSKDRQAEYHNGTVLQFVLIDAPSRPTDRWHRKVVRSHVMIDSTLTEKSSKVFQRENMAISSKGWAPASQDIRVDSQ